MQRYSFFLIYATILYVFLSFCRSLWDMVSNLVDSIDTICWPYAARLYCLTCTSGSFSRRTSLSLLTFKTAQQVRLKLLKLFQLLLTPVDSCFYLLKPLKLFQPLNKLSYWLSSHFLVCLLFRIIFGHPLPRAVLLLAELLLVYVVFVVVYSFPSARRGPR